MGVLTGTKAQKKQPATSEEITSQTESSFEKALLALEDICFDILNNDFTNGSNDTDRIMWQQKLKNLATPISLALNEYKGPRVFHHHYVHDKKDADKLVPVMEPARDNLLKACERGLEECEKLSGVAGSSLSKERGYLCNALRQVIVHS